MTNPFEQFDSRLSNIESLLLEIELLYGFRYIGKKFRVSLNKLRKIRNHAAHTSEEFNLKDYTNSIEEMIEFKEDIHYVVSELSMNNLQKLKKLKLEKIYLDKGFPIDDQFIEKS
jgi:hypothetical protein